MGNREKGGMTERMTDSLQKKSEWSAVHSDVVPLAGVEPARSCPRRILSPLRLPISPQRRIHFSSSER